jgi:DNA (cytosine-5)-methyltransferase 1
MLEATDIFCGAGGSSNGLEWVRCPVCGRSLIRVVQAINHWDLAVQAHNANFPHADHDVHDVEDIPPSRFRRTDILWASPDCSHHAYCRGPKDYSEAAFRSRATFADIIRWVRHHRYDAVIVENVVEARLWCDELGHPEKCSCGATFEAWVGAMRDLGYEGQVVYFNSQFASVPQSRDRMYVVFWRVGARRPNLDFRPVSWCPACATIVWGVQTWKPPSRRGVRSAIFEWGRYGQQYFYGCPHCRSPVAPAVRGAKTIIDWAIPIERIGDKPATKCKTCGRRHPVACNTRRRIRVGVENLGRRQPVQVQVGGNLFERQGYARVWALDDPLRTVVGTSYMGLVTPAGGQDAAARSLEEPTHTVLGNDRLAVAVRVGGQAAAPRLVDEPMITITAHDRQIGLVTAAGGPTGSGRNGRSSEEPVGTVMPDSHSALAIQNMAHNGARAVEEPTPPVTAGANRMLVHAAHGGDARPPRDLAEPTPAIAGHGELGLVTLRSHDTGRSLGEPATAVSAGGQHHGLLIYNDIPGFVRDLDDTAGTVTGRDKQALMVPYFRTGIPRTTEEPTGALTSRDRAALVITDAEIDDYLFRMLKWPELLCAQTMELLPDGQPYLLTARRRNTRGKFVELSDELRVKMIGNAVSSHVATAIGAAVAEALAR